MSSLASRIKTYSKVSTALSLISDKNLVGIIEKSEIVHSGIGGTAVKLEIEGSTIFVKQIPLTDLEREPQNIMSTANIFDLPLYYQYGVGSAGFGAWRELATHIMTTNWVLTGECPNFPLMYHYRILPTEQKSITVQQSEELESKVEYWSGSSSVRRRLEAINNSSSVLVVFLEHIPHVMYKWLDREFAKGDEATELAIEHVETNLKSIITFTDSKGLLHFDAHFANILTDGKDIYLADFGLALCSKFDLTEAEISFFKKHKNYDFFQAFNNLIYKTSLKLIGNDEKIIKEVAHLLPELLQSYDSGKATSGLTPSVARILKRYYKAVFAWYDFFEKIKNNDKQEPYPERELQFLWSEIDFN